MAGTLDRILANKADLVEGKLKTEQIPAGIGGITLNDVKADSEVAAALSHASLTPHIQFSGLAKITVGTVQPSNPTIGDLWIQTS